MGTPRIDRLEYNKIINGNLDFWQRGAGPVTISGSASLTYIADRFGVAGVGVSRRGTIKELKLWHEHLT